MNPLEDLINLEKDARQFGFDWPCQEMIIDQAISECKEIKEAIAAQDADHIQEEIGDLLHTAISLCIFSGFDVEDTLAKIAKKFDARMEALKFLTQEQGLKDLQGQSMDFMLKLWERAKKFNH